MGDPLLTGQVADQLHVTEPRLNDLIRRGKIVPIPPVVGGRRLWGREHVAAAERAIQSLEVAADVEAAR